MRCSEAKLRLNRLLPDYPASGVDRELQAHLESCPACAKEAVLTGKLNMLFSQAKAGDDIALPSLESQRNQVEARLCSPGAKSPVIKHLSWGLSANRPAWSLLGAVAAVVLITLTLLPFKHEIIVGYHVALAGVDLELAEDCDRICDMLDRLGLTDLAVDVQDCDATCRVVIFDLKSEDEVELMLACLTDANEVSLTSDIIPVRTSTTGSWWSRKLQATK